MLYHCLRKLVEDTMEGHQNAKEAKKKLREFKQKIGIKDWLVFSVSCLTLSVLLSACMYVIHLSGYFFDVLVSYFVNERLSLISVQDVAKESQEMMRKALEEVSIVWRVKSVTQRPSRSRLIFNLMSFRLKKKCVRRWHWLLKYERLKVYQ